jgi:dTDP-4-amino-4,6-dideoxygalactose transaminase
MSDLHAAIGLTQIAKLDKFNEKRQDNAAFYNKYLKGVTTPFVPDGCVHVYHQYTVRVPGGKRDALRTYLAEHEIGSEVYYPVPINKQSFYITEYGYNVTLPETEKAALEVLSLPVHPGISAGDREKVVSTINEFMAKG